MYIHGYIGTTQELPDVSVPLLSVTSNGTTHANKKVKYVCMYKCIYFSFYHQFKISV